MQERVLKVVTSRSMLNVCWICTIVAAGLIVTNLVASSTVAAADETLERLEETAFKQATALADPSIVRIETVGGLEQVDNVLIGNGPTSGVVVSADGFVISSSFNFISKPTSILVTLADGRHFAAKLIASDRLRLLTLLKVDAEGLIPAKPTPRDQITVGPWTLALGRTLDLSTPSLSVGIVSALNRVWGKAIQTDAKTSPVNYGGALIDIEGRVMGIIAPLSPSGGGDTAGVEWYDGGIGFAIPLEDVYESLERLKGGSDLFPGLMGITFAGGQSLNIAPVVDRVRYNSPAQQAGLKTNDRIVEVDGEKIVRISQLKQVLGRKYAGDFVKLVVARADKTLPVDILLVEKLVPYEIPFLGVLPERIAVSAEPGSAKGGVAIRFLFTKSPADKGGIGRGDRISKYNDIEVQDARSLSDLVGRNRPGDRAKVTFLRDGQESSVDVVLGSLPEDVASDLPSELILPTPKKVGAEPVENAELPVAKKDNTSSDSPKTGRFAATLPGHDHDYWAYVPENYTESHRYGLIVWVHPGGDTMEASIFKEWKPICDRRGLILVAPKADNNAGWQQGEAEFIKLLIVHMREKYAIDPARIVMHSYGTGAGMASLVSTKHRDVIRGIAIAGAPFLGAPAENEPDSRQQYMFVCGDGDKNFSKVKASVEGLRKLKFPVSFRTIKGLGAKYPEESAIEEIGRWVDSLDRI